MREQIENAQAGGAVNPVEPGAPEVLTVGRIGVDLYPSVDGHPEPLGAPLTTFAPWSSSVAPPPTSRWRRPGSGAARRPHQGRAGPVRRRTCATALAGFGVDPRFVGTAGPADADRLLRARPARGPAAAVLPAARRTGPHAHRGRRPVGPRRRRPAPLGDRHRRERRPRALHPARHAGAPEPARAGARSRWTVLDLDWRPMFWPSPQDARREYARMLEHVDVAVGNRDEVEVAVGTPRPGGGRPAAARPRAWSSSLVKKGGDGVLVATPDAMDTVAPRGSTSSTGSAPATPSAARCATACSRAGTTRGPPDSPTPPVRSSPSGSPAPTRCPRSTSSRRCSPDGGERRDPPQGTAAADPRPRSRRSPTMAQQIRDDAAGTSCWRPGPTARRAVAEAVRRRQRPEGSSRRPRHPLPGGGRPPGARARSASGRRDGDGRPARAARAAADRPVPARRRRGARLARRRRGAAAARRARGQGRRSGR